MGRNPGFVNVTWRSDVYPYISPAQFGGSLTGQVALITGAGRGIGTATAMAFARAGAHGCLSVTDEGGA
jgi:hypothetical protein